MVAVTASNSNHAPATLPSKAGDKSALYVHLFGKRVDVTRWASSHPGGKKILAIFRDRDATEQFTAMHTKDARVGDIF